MFLWIEPNYIIIQIVKHPTFSSIASSNKAKPSIIAATKTKRRTGTLHPIFVPIAVHNDIVIIVGQQAPSARANSLVVRLNQISTTLSITFIRQLHHFGPLIKATVIMTIQRIIFIAVAFNLGIIFLIFKAIYHFTDIQVLYHRMNRCCFSRGIFTFKLQVFVSSAISIISEFFIFITIISQIERLPITATTRLFHHAAARSHNT